MGLRENVILLIGNNDIPQSECYPASCRIEEAGLLKIIKELYNIISFKNIPCIVDELSDVLLVNGLIEVWELLMQSVVEHCPTDSRTVPFPLVEQLHRRVQAHSLAYLVIVDHVIFILIEKIFNGVEFSYGNTGEFFFCGQIIQPKDHIL